MIIFINSKSLIKKMAVKIDKKHIEICDSISNEINKKAYAIKKWDIKEYERLLNAKNYSVEKKKKELAMRLRRLMVDVFADGMKRKAKKAYLSDLRKNLLVLIGITTKLNRMNRYLQSVFLQEAGIIKPKSWKAAGDRKKTAKEPGYLSKEELAKIENAVCRLIEKIMLMDKNLLKKYKKREEKVVEKEKIKIKDLDKIIGRESELLDHIEAKLPPPKKLTRRLLKKQNFDHWMLTALALLSAFENEYRKELVIFERLKQNHRLRKKIEAKISELVKEKEELFKIKEKKIKSIKDVSSMEKEFRSVFHNFASASSL